MKVFEMSVLTQSSSHQNSENSSLSLGHRRKDPIRVSGVPEHPIKLRGQESEIESLYHFLNDYFSHQHNSILIVIAFFILAGVGILNYLAGPDLSSWIFYLIPIFLVTWRIGKWMGVLMSTFSALIWSIAEHASGATYLDNTIPYWNCIARLSYFLILTFVLSALKSAIEKEKELSRVDFLTGVGNGRYFIELADMEINRARRYEHPLTVAYIDLDNFKAINDRFGHSTGDYLLRLVANTIKNNIRVTDTVSRVGGDEFAILLPETGTELGEAITHKIQKINLELMQKNGWPVTFSIGVVTFISPPSTVDEILKKSDNLMYSAKKSGKNRINYEVSGIREWPSVTAA